MKRVIMVLAVSLSFSALPQAVMAQAVPVRGESAKRSPMPPERAQATFTDERVKTFLAVVAKEFGGTCTLPEYAKTEAKLTQIGSGDFSSSFYEIAIPCQGKEGLAGVQITAEFSPPLGTPLNLVLALRYQR